jgi:hypothetical protein
LGFHVPYARRGPHGEDDRYYIKFNEPQSHELISKVQNHQHNLGTVSHTRATVAQLAHIVFSTEARLKNDMPPAIARKMRSACRKFGNARMDLDETLEEYVEYMAGV